MQKDKRDDVKILVLAGIILLVLFITFQGQDIKESFRGTITGFGALSQTDYCRAAPWGSNGYWFTATVDCDAVPADGATFNAANTELDCRDKSLTASISTALFAMNLSKQSSNMTVKRCQITNFAKFGIEIVSTNHSRIYDTNISGSGTYDLVLSSRSNNITVLNTTFTTVKVYNGANYTRQWYVDVRVNYSNGSVVDNAKVVAFNHSFADYRQTASSLGKTRFNATEYVNHSGTTTWFKTYKINATDGRYTKTNSTVRIGSGNVKIQLEITPDDPPNVTNLTYPFNATTLTSVPIDFNFTVYDDWNATNCSLYANFNTSWVRNLTTYPDTNNSWNGTFRLSPSEGTYKWNVLCYDNSTNVQKDWFTSNFTFTLDLPSAGNTGGGSGGGGGGGGDKEICKDECEIGEKSCDGNKIKICGYDEDYCKVFNQYQECKENEVCANGKCFEKCVNECETSYEKCSGNSIEKCYLSKDSTGQSCYRSSTINCGEEKSCIEGRCIKIEKPILIQGKGNKTITNTIIIGGSAAVISVIAISWWLWLLPFLIPFLFLRFRHYYVKVIDLEDCLEMNKEKEKKLILEMENKFNEKFGLTEQNKEYRNLNIEKGGSLEILEEKPFSLIAHFDKKKRAEKFKESLKEELGKIAKGKESKTLLNSIQVEREHFTFTKRMVHLVKLLFKRKHKVKVIKRFKKESLANNLEQFEMFYSGLDYLLAKLEKRIKEKIWYIGFDYSESGRESFLLDKGGKIELRIKKLGKFEFRLEAEKKRVNRLKEGFEEVLGRVFERREMWKLSVKGYRFLKPKGLNTNLN